MLIQTITPNQFTGNVRQKMLAAGYIKTEVYFNESNEHTYRIAYFTDGTLLDSREPNFFDKFHIKIYHNE